MKPPAPLCDLYVLNEKKQVVPAKTYKEWRLAQLRTDRTVAQNQLGHCVMWTYFTGHNRNPRGGAPLTFQTEVTGLSRPFPHRYYATWAAAWDGHALTMAMLARILGIVSWTQRPFIVGLDGGKHGEKKPARASAWPQDDPYQLRSNQ